MRAMKIIMEMTTMVVGVHTTDVGVCNLLKVNLHKNDTASSLYSLNCMT